MSQSRIDAAGILAELNPEQRQAVEAVTGPVAILAGAGTGKTRVISHRVAYAVATGSIDEREVLVVSFTTKAAGEMVARLRGLGLRRARASTLHAAALEQLRYFWPMKRGTELPRLIASKLPLIRPLARALPGHYRFTTAKDLANEIEWAKNRRIDPQAYERRATAEDRSPPIPVDLFRRLYADYERSKSRSARLDFEDLLEETIRLYESDAAAAALVRRRFTWFSVDEYQDTNPLQQALLEAWLGDRLDIGVVGDPNQTIYSFTGASPKFLLDFTRRFPAATTISLVRNYRSTPQVLTLANRLVGARTGPKLKAISSDGPEPEIRRHADESSELDAMTQDIRDSLRDGTPATEIAVLTRTNYQLEPIANHLRAQGIAFRFTGTPFFRSQEVRAAIRALAVQSNPPDTDLQTFAVDRWRALGYTPEESKDDPEAAARQQAFETLLAIVRRVMADDPDASVSELIDEFERLAGVEADTQADGVTLSTIHGAKGAEWEAVLVPMLEEGSLPIYHALENRTQLDEERRLLYVALTRAKRRLVLSWAAMRTTPKGKQAKQRPSRFLTELEPRRDRTPGTSRTAPSRRPEVAPGARVLHSRHGEGTVRSVGGWYAAVAFARGKIANVDITYLSVLGSGDGTSQRPPEPSDSSGGTPLDNDRHQRNFTRLAEWRRERARQDGVPAFVVAHDTTLRAIAAAQPANETALARIAGMGPVKIERYGEEICEIIRRAR